MGGIHKWVMQAQSLWAIFNQSFIRHRSLFLMVVPLGHFLINLVFVIFIFITEATQMGDRSFWDSCKSL